MICKNCYEMNKKFFEVWKIFIKFKEDINEGDIIWYIYWNLWYEVVVVKILDKENEGKNEEKIIRIIVECEIVYYVFCGLFFYWIIKKELKIIWLDGKCFKFDYVKFDYDVYNFDEVVKCVIENFNE